jgi:hypothetical protein
MNTIDLLMGLDAEELAELPTKELKIVRLSKKAGADCIVKIKAIPPERFTELTSGIRSKDGTLDTAEAYKANVKVATAGMVNPPLTDASLMEHFGASTPGQLIKKIFNGAEISAIADEVTKLSGFDGNVIEEIKN